MPIRAVSVGASAVEELAGDAPARPGRRRCGRSSRQYRHGPTPGSTSGPMLHAAVAEHAPADAACRGAASARAGAGQARSGAITTTRAGLGGCGEPASGEPRCRRVAELRAAMAVGGRARSRRRARVARHVGRAATVRRRAARRRARRAGPRTCAASARGLPAPRLSSVARGAPPRSAAISSSSSAPSSSSSTDVAGRRCRTACESG